MIALTTKQWMLLSAAVGIYLVSCCRLAWFAWKTGRSPAAWFFITFFGTPLTATILFWYFHYRSMANQPPKKRSAPAPAKRDDGTISQCQHCNAQLTADTIDDVDGSQKCLQCGLPLDGDTTA